MAKKEKVLPVKWILLSHFSKLVDYFLVYSLFHYFHLFEQLPLIISITVFLLAGFVFEVMQLKICKTTLGLYILGRKYKNALSLLFCIQIALGFLRDSIKKNRVIHAVSKRYRLLIVAAYTMVASLSWACFNNSIGDKGYSLANYRPFGSETNWIEYYAEEVGFKAFFPKAPALDHIDLGVKDNNKPLSYRQYTVLNENQISYSVCYMEVPKKWKIFGSNAFLKGAIGIIIKNTPNAKLINKEITEHNSCPALDFCYQVDGKEVTGRLIIDGLKLYKLSVEYDLSQGVEGKKELFISSFLPAEK